MASDALDEILGRDAPKLCVGAVRSVYNLTLLDKVNPDPHHEAHWWEWKDWPMDGRQYEYNRSTGRYELQKDQVREHQRRAKLNGYEDSGLKIERKLEGAIWGKQKFPMERTTIRASTKVPRQIFVEAKEKILEGVDHTDEDDDDEKTVYQILARATNPNLRPFCDASIYTQDEITANKDDPVQLFQRTISRRVLSLRRRRQRRCYHQLLVFHLHRRLCTSGEQRDSGTVGVPCLCFSAHTSKFDANNSIIPDMF